EHVAPTVAATVDAVAIAPMLDSRTRLMERTHDLVALHAMRLQQIGDETLQVVIKPGAGLHLALELRQRNDAIEVRAALHSGDFEHLSRNWADLQSRLEARGIRLASLACAEQSTNAGTNGFRQSQRHPAEQDPVAAGAFAELSL